MFASEGKKFAFFLPNIFTALNMGCGFSAVIMASKGLYYQACMMLLLGAIFDSVDGRVARLTGTQSVFGEEFDSLSDVITFGFAPAIICYLKFFSHLGRLGIVVSFIYLLCGALRLARFNANIDKISSSNFQGLPIPGAAMAIIGYILLSLEWNELNNIPYFTIGYLVFYSLLMISSISFPSFKNSPFVKKHKKAVLAIIFLILALIFIYEEIMVGIIITLYVFLSLVYFFATGGKFADIFHWKGERESDGEE